MNEVKILRTIISLGLVAGLLLCLSAVVSRRTFAQVSGWSEPVNISNSLNTSWFPAVAVDAMDRVHVVWSENHLGFANDFLLYTAWDGLSWSEPNDLVASPPEGEAAYTLRPSIVVDRADNVHLLYRYPAEFQYTKAPADMAWSAQSWTPPHRISDEESSWADMVVDSKGVAHAIWSERAAYILPGGVSVLLPGSTLFDKAGDSWLNYTPSDGLASDIVLDIAIDASDLKWFATDAGLSVLSADGSRWMGYTVADGLVSDQVQKVLIDEIGNKWLATQKGVSVLGDGATPFDKSDDVWMTYTSADGLAGDNVLDMAIDITGRVWFATDEGMSVLSVADGKWMSFAVADGLVSDFVQAILIDRAGHKWLGTRRGVSVLNDRGTLFDKSDDVWMTYTYESGLGSGNVLAIASDAEGRKWFGTTSGLSLLRDGGTPFSGLDDVWVTYTARDGLSDDIVMAITMDVDGNMWIGTAAGLSVFSPGNDRQVSYTVDDGVAQSLITSVAVDQDRQVWLGTGGGEQDYFSSDVYYRRSANGGRTWSSPKNLSRSRSRIGMSLHLHIDAQDVLHAVWDEAQSCGYVSSSDGGETWSRRATFYSSAGSPSQIVAGIDGEGDILIAWRTASQSTSMDEQLPIYYQLSSDGGISWSEPAPIPNLLGRAFNDTPYDAYDMTVDSAGHVHLVVVGRAGTADTALSVLHTEWDGNAWSAPTRIFGTTDFPERPAITVSRGNQLHVVWFVRNAEDLFAGGGDYQVWYSQGQSAAHSVPPPPSPTPSPTPTSTPAPVPLPSPTPYPTLAPGASGLPEGVYTESDEIAQLAVALLPLVVLIVLLMAIRLGWLGKLFR